MDISYNWLKRYIDFEMSPRQLAAALTSLGLECDHIEEVETVRGGLKGLVVGEVLTCIDHPDSDHLHITTVNVGQDAPLQIVCGAPNVAAGQKVIVATIGTKLYDGDKEFVIKKSKMRGTESFGMICAQDEIGLGSDHDGIMVLDAEAKPGTPAAEYFNLESDFMLEVELTPNRVDGASHYGVARDLKAYLARHAYTEGVQTEIPQLRLPSMADFQPDSLENATPIEVLDPARCPRYSGVTVRGVKVAESPDWLKKILVAAGQRPINNIVDITNFILLGLGQPLHCFDLNKIAGDKIVVRTCPSGTKFVTLDEQERTLNEADLMICDAEKPLCIAGVFGGLESGVTENTTDVFIESAYFNPTSVRRTARRHGLNTDASFRYERGTDPNITIYAAMLAASLIKDLAGGEICGEVKDFYPHPVERAKIDLEIEYMNRLIGKEIPLPLVKLILKALEIDIRPDSTEEVLHLEVPTYRVDVTRPCDVVEDILRVYGYNNIEISTEMHANLSQVGATDFSYAMQQLISEMLSARGYNEILNNSLSAAYYYPEQGIWAAAENVKVINPLSGDLSVMRRSLIFGGLETIAHNINRKSPDLKLYEFGSVYKFDPSKESTPDAPLAPYSEKMQLALWITGQRHAAGWNQKADDLSIFDLKADVYAILHRLGVSEDALKTAQTADDIFAARLDICNQAGKPIAMFGMVRTALLKKFDIEQPVFFASFEWNNIIRIAAKNQVLFSQLPKSHPVKRDLALLLDDAVTFAQVEETVRRSDRKLLRDVALFDVYAGKGVPQGKKSYAISITLQDNEKTLVDKQIDAVMKKITTNLEKNLGASLR